MTATSVAILGPLGTYTHQAALAHFKTATQIVPFETIPDAFQALLSSSHVISHAVLPLANSSNGPVAATQDFLQKHGKELVQLDSLSLEIQHALMRTAPAPGQSLPELQVITSHEQALGQCRQYLDSRYSSLQRRQADSTAAAAEYAASHPEAAAICSQMAGDIFNLQLLDDGAQHQGIQDAGMTNKTTFGIFQRAA